MVTSEWPTDQHPEWAPFIVQQVRFLRKLDVDIDVFAFRGGRDLQKYVRARFELRRGYPLDEYDLIHAQFGQSGLIVFPSKKPVVVTFHGSDLQGIVNRMGRYTLQGKLLQFLSRWVAKQADAVIVVSERLKRFLPGRLSPHVIPGGVDFSLFYPMPQKEAREQLGLPSDIIFVLFPARWDDPVKNYPLAEKAVHLLKDQLGCELISLQNVAHDRVNQYLNACDALLITSYHEGSPTVVKEALACNLPVVAVDVGDVRERIRGVDGCVLCEGRSPSVIAESLMQVLSHRGRIQGRKAVQELDEEQIARRVLDVYKSAIN